MSKTKNATLYQFRITLIDSDPLIWRQVQVPDCTLDELHEHIQTAMGWTNSHLHRFEIDGNRYGDPELLDDGSDDFECIDSTVTHISEILPDDGSRFRFQYLYDFGDYWEHEILFEMTLQAEAGVQYPKCVDGERACPPEDVGGSIGYTEFLEALADPDHAEHDAYLEWSGPFEPEEFDAGKATEAMQSGLPDSSG